MSKITILIVLVLTSLSLFGQSLKSLQTSSKPLVLKAQGSFYVGGITDNQTFEQ